MKKNKDVLTRRIQNGIAKPFSDELIKLIRPAIKIIPNNKQSISKFGGIPLIEKGKDWIRNPINNKPYAFLLQIDLEEIQAFDIEERLPKKGILSIWFDLDYWDVGKVIYYKNKKELVDAKVPAEIKEEEKRIMLPVWKRIFTKRRGYKLFPERFVNFKIEYHAPSWHSLQIELFHLQNGTKPRDLEIDEKYIDDYYCEYQSEHHLFGYYVGLQESVYELMKTTNGRFPNELTEELIKEGLKWKLLLQIDSDEETAMSWADWGKILFFIKEEDLKEQNFENIIVQLDTT